MAHPFTRVVVTGLVLAGLGAEPAGAGTFHVYGLGLNGAGCPNGWQAQTLPPDRFRHGNFCSRWEIQSVRDGTALQQGDFAGTSMFAGDRRALHRLLDQVERHRAERRRLADGHVRDAVRELPEPLPEAGHVDRDRDAARQPRRRWIAVLRDAPVGRRHVRRPRPAPTRFRRAAPCRSRIVESHAVVEDYTPPGAPSLGGVSSGWNSGQKQLRYSASDAGSGIESATLTVDGSLHRTNNHSCSRLPTGGYTQPVPCATVDQRRVHPERAGAARRRPPHARGHGARRERRGRGLVAGLLGRQQRPRPPDRADGGRRRRLARHERLLGHLGEPGPGQRVADRRRRITRSAPRRRRPPMARA